MSAEAERLNREYAELVERQERGENVRVEIFGITEEAGERGIVLGEQPEPKQPNVWCSKSDAVSPCLESKSIPEMLGEVTGHDDRSIGVHLDWMTQDALLDDLELITASLQDAFPESHAAHMAAFRILVALRG